MKSHTNLRNNERNKGLVGRLILDSLKQPLSYVLAGALAFGAYGTYRLTSTCRAIDRAFIELVDTNKDGMISLDEKKVVTDYIIDHDSGDGINPSTGVIYSVDLNEIRKNGVNADLNYSVKKAYLGAKGIKGDFESGI